MKVRNKNEMIGIRLSPDKMHAYLSLKLPDEEKLEPEDVFQRLQEEGIIHGIDVEAVKRLCGLSTSVNHELIAMGTLSTPGEDAIITYKFTPPDSKPKLTSDGNVDYYELGNIVEVDQGTVLAERIPPTPGVPGYNVLGEILQPLPGKNKPFKVGKGVIITENTAIAEYTGSLTWQHGKVSVGRMLIIQGDVDFGVGNIDFPGKVKITGNVRSGFKVQALEDIEVAGCIEDASVFSQNGAVIVHAGIIGAGKAVVHAKTNIGARFIQEASVEAGNNIIANEYIIRSNIKAGNAVLIQGLKGRLLGTNQIRAGTKIKVNSIQPNRGLSLEVQGINRNDTYMRIKHINQEIKALEETMRTYSVNIRLLSHKKDESSVSNLKTLLSEYMRITEESEELKEEKLHLTELLKGTKGEGMIEVRSEIDDDVFMSIKGNRLRLSNPVSNVTMYYDEQEKRIIVLQN